VSGADSTHEAYDFIIVAALWRQRERMRLAQRATAWLWWKPESAGRRRFSEEQLECFKYFWAPKLRCFGIQNITLLKGVMVLHARASVAGALCMQHLDASAASVFRRSGVERRCALGRGARSNYETARRMLALPRTAR